MTKTELKKTEWYKAFRASVTKASKNFGKIWGQTIKESDREAIDRACREAIAIALDPKIVFTIVQEPDHVPENFWIITTDDGFWMDSFEHLNDAKAFCKEMNWNFKVKEKI